MKQTKFYNIHKKLNAKIVEFSGFLMPIQYTSIIAEHKAVRNSVGVFDVSHMGEIFVKGEKALDFTQKITINDASKLFPGRIQYSAMCYEDGGIVDDLLVYCLSQNEFMFVVNASNIEKDFEWMKKNSNEFNGNVELRNASDDYSLLAVQGPKSKDVLLKICDFDPNLEYYHFQKTNIAGIEVLLSRTGYTGELGYEIYFIGDELDAEIIWNKIFLAGNDFNIQPIGLGARDTLRLEMGFCLYGNDIDETTNPLEAGLAWITKLNKPNFIGKNSLLKIKENGLTRKLTPLITKEKAIPRHGYEVYKEVQKAGYVTSGTLSPMLDIGIALAYINKEFLNEENGLDVLIRDKRIPVKITQLPFIHKQ